MSETTIGSVATFIIVLVACTLVSCVLFVEGVLFSLENEGGITCFKYFSISMNALLVLLPYINARIL